MKPFNGAARLDPPSPVPPNPAHRVRRGGSAFAVVGLTAALTLSACGTVHSGSGDLPALRIGTGTATGAKADSALAPGTYTSGYTLDGTLPDGPSTGPVARFGDGPSEDTVRALAAALHLSGTPVHHDHGWVVSSSSGELRVRDDASGAWSFSRMTGPCLTYQVDVDSPDANSGSACAVATDGGVATAPDATAAPGTPVPVASAPAAAATDVGTALPPDSSTGAKTVASGTAVNPINPSPSEPAYTGPSKADAIAAAEPVLTAAGLDGTPTALEGYGSQRSVVVDPTVLDLPTVGMRTVVDVDNDGVLGAMGWLGTASLDRDYPLISAKTAFDRLASLPQPEPALARDCPVEVSPSATGDDPVPCGSWTPTPAVVTGATLGLQMWWEGSAPILVPTWLFTVTGWSDPLTMIAVQDSYLADPTTDPGGSGSSPGSSGSAVPPSSATEKPAPPPSVDPGTGGGTDGSAGVETPSITGAGLSDDGMVLKVTFYGGVCSEYSVISDESDTTVKVQVTGRSTIGPDQACVEIAKEYTLPVKLAAPLGDRQVIDASTGERVQVAMP